MATRRNQIGRRVTWGLAVLLIAGSSRNADVISTLADARRSGTIHEASSFKSEPDQRYASRLPLIFEANAGQTDSWFRFLIRGSEYEMLFAPTEVVLTPTGSNQIGMGPHTLNLQKALISRNRGTRRRMTMSGGNPESRIIGINELPGKRNYFVGSDPKKWLANIPTYGGVKYEQAYPGVDIIYYSNFGRLECDYVIAPGADTSVIDLAFDGLGTPEIDGEGNLISRSGDGELCLQRPTVYQEEEGVRQQVNGRYAVRNGRVGFQVEGYDSTRPLVIDPVLVYSSYLSSAGVAEGFGIAVDSSDNAYVTGSTGSLDSSTPDAFQNNYNGKGDAFVMKLNPEGSAPIYITYIGGSDAEEGRSIAVDSQGNAYVTGITKSADFPTVNPIQFRYGGSSGENRLGDAFIAKLNPAGSKLIYSTYLGGTGDDAAWRIALDKMGDALVIGQTRSPDFPLANPLQSASGGADDAFVAKINPAGSALVYSTYLGGKSFDIGEGIALDSSGNAYVTGLTGSNDFPTKRPLQAQLGGGAGGFSDAFVAKLNASGSRLIYSTYLGGEYSDYGLAIAIDGSGNAYITGSTGSPDFPRVNAFHAVSGSGAFVCKLDSRGSSLVYSTILAGFRGSGGDVGTDIAVDSEGQASVAGAAFSGDFPILHSLQRKVSFNSDAFIAKLNASGNYLLFSTLLGGYWNGFPPNASQFAGDDAALSTALDSQGNIYVTGHTLSYNFPTTLGAYRTEGFLGFVSKISLSPGGSDEGAAVLTGIQVLRKGDPVDHLIAGSKGRKYQLVITGTRIEENTDFYINGFPLRGSRTREPEPKANVLLGGRIPDVRVMTVYARSGSQVSNLMTIDVRDN